MIIKWLLLILTFLGTSAELFAIEIPRVRTRWTFYNCEDYEARCREASSPPSAFCSAAQSTCEGIRYIQQLILVPHTTNKILVRAGQYPNLHIYFSPDNGRRWARVLNRVTLAMGINYKGTALAADDEGRLYESRDGGLSWREIGTLPPGGGARTIFFDKINPRKVYVAIQLSSLTSADTASIHISEDGGRTFVPSPFDLPTEDWPVNIWIVWKINQNRNNGTLYAGMEYEGPLPDPYHAPLLRSTDGGETWENVYDEVRGHIIDIEVDEQNNIVYAHNEGFDLYKSLDNGETWEAILWPYVFNIAINETNPSELFLGETFWPEECGEEGCEHEGHIFGLGRIWRTPDGGETFEFLDETGGLHVSDLAFNPLNTTLYVATYGQGLRRYVVSE